MKLLEWLRASTLDLYLWVQRRSWPVPEIFRTVARNFFARTIKQVKGGRTGEWAHPLVPGDGGDKPIQFQGNDLAGHPADTSTAKCVRLASDVLRSDGHPRLRCVVATGVIGFGGLDRVAALLARRLPSHGLDTTIVYFDDAPVGHHGTGEGLADALRLEGVPVVKLSPRHGQQWLKAHVPDIISIHGVPDWFVDVAAETGIPVIETLHGAHSFFEPRT